MYFLYCRARVPITITVHSNYLWQKGYSAFMYDSAMRTWVSVNQVDANENLLLK